MSGCDSSSGPTLEVTVTDTTCVRTAVVVQITYNVYVDPCGYLTTVLADQVRTDLDVPTSSVLTCSLVSVSILSDGRRSYRWDVTATWTE